MFNLLTSRYREIEKALIEDVLDQRQADALSSLLVLSPSGHMLERLQRQLAEKAPSLLNIHFLTFYALAERLLAGASYTERIVTEPAVYQEIIRDILVGEASEPVDRAIREALHTEGKPIPKGLAGALAATMKDLRDAGMRADKALEVAREGFLGKEAPEAASTLALYGRMIGILRRMNCAPRPIFCAGPPPRRASIPGSPDRKPFFSTDSTISPASSSTSSCPWPTIPTRKSISRMKKATRRMRMRRGY